MINLLIEADRVELLAGDPQVVAVPREGGKKAEDLALPELPGRGLQPVHAPSGAIRSRRYARRPASVAPDVHIFTRSKLPWVALPDSVPAFAVYYDTNKLWPAASLERLEALTAPASSEA